MFDTTYTYTIYKQSKCNKSTYFSVTGTNCCYSEFLIMILDNSCDCLLKIIVGLIKQFLFYKRRIFFRDSTRDEMSGM